MSPTHALKEWSIVCDLLASGRIALLPRKGGIREWGGPGVFEAEHRRFWLFPTTEHEKRDRIKPRFLETAPAMTSDEKSHLTLRAWAETERIWKVPSREAFDRLDDLHPWLPEAIDMRFDYKPENPLYLLALRTHRIETPISIPRLDAYRGCRSWVPLATEVVAFTAESSPAIDDTSFSDILHKVDEAFAS